MSSSYKPALLKALVRVVRGGAESPISVLQIGHEFVNLYWVQTVVFRLRQAATITAEPEVVRRIRSASDMTGVRRLSDLPADSRMRLDCEMARILKINVLDRFHRSAPSAMKRLYDWRQNDQFITSDEETLAFLRIRGHVLEMIANHWWARYLERVNMLAPLIIEKVERNGAERGSLAKYLKILRVTDRTHCFYCERPIDGTETPHVDHVIPWSFLLSNPLWDLVLSCASCNLAKSDVLPDSRYLDKLAAIAVNRGKRTLPAGVGSPLVTRDELDRYYSAAISVEWPSGWMPVA
jgi:5-methylcytosine-specific restriction endonuclease McrA